MLRHSIQIVLFIKCRSIEDGCIYICILSQINMHQIWLYATSNKKFCHGIQHVLNTIAILVRNTFLIRQTGRYRLLHLFLDFWHFGRYLKVAEIIHHFIFCSRSTAFLCVFWTSSVRARPGKLLTQFYFDLARVN